jgi:hypothetical protein
MIGKLNTSNKKWRKCEISIKIISWMNVKNIIKNMEILNNNRNKLEKIN